MCVCVGGGGGGVMMINQHFKLMIYTANPPPEVGMRLSKHVKSSHCSGTSPTKSHIQGIMV